MWVAVGCFQSCQPALLVKTEDVHYRTVRSCEPVGMTRILCTIVYHEDASHDMQHIIRPSQILSDVVEVSDFSTAICISNEYLGLKSALMVIGQIWWLYFSWEGGLCCE